MERAAFDAILDGEESHWWFLGRRAVLADVIRRIARPPAGARVLDMGCGSGGNLEMLAEFGRVTAVEDDDAARAVAEARGIGPTLPGRLPGPLEGVEGEFDLIALFDVLEHVEEDVAALQTLGELLANGGRIVMSVPAHPWLWSHHDEVHHHFRRYSKASLSRTVEAAGLSIAASGWLNSLLFPAAMGQRLVLRATGRGSEMHSEPPGWLNTLLGRTFAAERHLVGRVPLPIGLSRWAVLER